MPEPSCSTAVTRPRVLMMESGGWGGIHTYAHQLCDALAPLALDLALLTNERYELEARAGRFPLLRLLRRENYLVTLWRLWRLLRERRPQVFHIQSMISQRKDLLLLLLCRLLGVRIVLTVHNLLPHEVRPLERGLYLLYYRLADALILHSQKNRQALLALAPALDARRLWVIPHGDYAAFADGAPSREEARQQLGLPLDRRIVLFFGAIRPYKGLDLLLEAVPAVRAARPQALFAVAGTILRGERADYDEQIARLGLDDEDLATRFDYLTTEESIAYVRAADLVVLPYRQIYQSGVLLFAFSFGRPVLATRVGSFPETVEEGENGWLIEPENTAQLQQSLIDLLGDPGRLEEVGARARQLATERYGWPGIAEQTLQLYRQLLDETS